MARSTGIATWSLPALRPALAPLLQFRPLGRHNGGARRRSAPLVLQPPILRTFLRARSGVFDRRRRIDRSLHYSASIASPLGKLG